MDKLNAGTGWVWIKEGFRLFRKQPAELLTLFFAYMFLSMGIGFIPVAGEFLPIILIPVFSMAFMEACRQIEQGKRVYPNLLLSGFRSPAFVNLLLLGLLYLLAISLAVLASSLVDDGVFLSVLTGKTELDAKNMQEINMMPGMLFSALVYAPAMMGFWYAGPLIAWKRMSVGKAIFYSFFAVWRAGKAFTVYGLAWAGLCIMLPTLISVPVLLIFGQPMVIIFSIISVSLVLTVVMYSSFYPTYTQVFGQPEEQA